MRKRLALDTNLLLDLAGGADAAHEFRETFQGLGYSLHLPPTAALELHEHIANAEAAEKRALAHRALLNVRHWEILPVDFTSLQEALAQEFARRILRERLLPPEEFNDAMILAETSVADIPILVSLDKHLLDAKEDALLLACNEADLPPVRTMHPKRLLRALR